MGSEPSRLERVLIALALVGCGAQVEGGPERSETQGALVGWAKTQFTQVLRVNPGPTTVRNVCELTVRRDDDKPMTIVATGTGGSTVTAGWTGSAISVSGLEVDACADPPCEVLIRWKGAGASGTAMGCQVAVDDATTRVVGSSSGTALTVVGSASAPIVFNQGMKLSASGSAISGLAVLRHGSVLPDARISNFG